MTFKNGNCILSSHEEDNYRRVVLSSMSTPGQRYAVKVMLDRIDLVLLGAPVRYKNGIPLVNKNREVLEVRKA